MTYGDGLGLGAGVGFIVGLKVGANDGCGKQREERKEGEVTNS